jgi:hypothetical protein
MIQNENDVDKEGSFRRCYPGYCSFCRKHYREVGPLAEGPDIVLICYGCAQTCARIIEGECQRRGIAMPWTIMGWWEKAAQDGDGKSVSDSVSDKSRPASENPAPESGVAATPAPDPPPRAAVMVDNSWRGRPGRGRYRGVERVIQR